MNAGLCNVALSSLAFPTPWLRARQPRSGLACDAIVCVNRLLLQRDYASGAAYYRCQS